MKNNLGNKETMAKNIRRYLDKRGKSPLGTTNKEKKKTPKRVETSTNDGIFTQRAKPV